MMRLSSSKDQLISEVYNVTLDTAINKRTETNRHRRLEARIKLF